MTTATKGYTIGIYIMAFLAIIISLYPIAFAFVPGADGLFKSKPTAVLESDFYLGIFYIHTSFGGLALFCGSMQFFKKLRQRRLSLHRTLGKIYVVSVLISGLCAFYISFYATGGIVSMLGFSFMAVLWLFTTYKAYTAIRKLNIDSHQRWMIRSYALCFAAVTLRIYLGISAGAGIAFMTIYPIIAWLSWVPNVFFAEYLIKRLPLEENRSRK
jgi:uncharacterized membrane protein